jgi:sterol desaturase/sphingolipid hydroxylase (fatty acid hydroxylase superfamily)
MLIRTPVEFARDVSDPVSAERAPRSRLLSAKAGYDADFVIYCMVVIALVAFASRGSRSDRLIWLAAAIAGASVWTPIEYLLHRFVLHRAPLIADLHLAHHASPRAYVSTPTWASLLVLGGLFFAPLWRLLSLNIALGAVTGIIAAWLWYGLVHHVNHHRRPRWLATALRAAAHRHFLHHSPYLSGNFGVTTALWDRLFRAQISARTRVVGVPVRVPESDL